MEKGASIFLIPVFILVLSIVSTFIDDSSVLKRLYSGVQTADSLVYDPSQAQGDAPADSPVDAVPADTQDTPPTTEEIPSENTTPTDPTIPPEIIPDETTTPTEPLETSGNTSAESTDITPAETTTPPQETQPDLTVIPEIIPPQEATVTEPEVATVTEDVIQKQNQFILTRQNIRTRYEITLNQIETSRKALAEKIDAMKTLGQDTTEAEQALEKLDQAISETKSSIRANNLPKTIPDLQKGILNYIIGIRSTIDSTMSALKDALTVTQ